VRFEPVAQDVGFTEGPAVVGGEVAFVSVDRGRIYAVGEGGCRVYAETAGGPNGLAAGLDGTLYVAQNGGRWSASPRPSFTGGVQAVSPAGDVRWLTRDPVAPNDLCLGPDGRLYVTDPTRRPEMDDGRIWAVEVETGDAELLVSVDWYPNGIGFGPDGALYVARTGEHQIVRFPSASRPLGAPEVFCELGDAWPDGFAWDAQGRMVVAAVGRNGARGTLRVHDGDGALVDTIAPGPGGHYTNLAITSDRLIYVTDADGGQVLRGDWPCSGLPLHPFRATEYAAVRAHGR
jgi:gluconolactonase